MKFQFQLIFYCFLIFVPEVLFANITGQHCFVEWAGAYHYNDVIVSAMASQITSLTIVYSTVYSRCRSKETSKLHFTGLCDENSPVSGEFPAQRASNAENVSIWWRHHATGINHDHGETIKRRCATISYLPIYSSLSGYVRSYRLIDTFNLKPSPLQMHASYAMGYLIWFHQWIHVTVPEDCIVPDNGNPWVERLLIKTLEDSLDSSDSISPVSTKWRHLKWLTKLERKSRLELNNWIRNLLNLLDERAQTGNTILTHWSRTKIWSFCRRHFQIHFRV